MSDVTFSFVASVGTLHDAVAAHGGIETERLSSSMASHRNGSISGDTYRSSEPSEQSRMPSHRNRPEIHTRLAPLPKTLAVPLRQRN
jgi:hypothetical protein